MVAVVLKKRVKTPFSNAFGRPLKFALLYVLKLHKYVFNRDIPQWSYLCELCENVTLLATGINKVLKDKLPMSSHDIMKKFSCSSSSKHYMYDACCEICSSTDINIPDNMVIIESPKEDSTDNGDDYHDDQSDQPKKKSVRFYEWGKSDEAKITKISRNLSVTDVTESLKQQIAVVKRHLFTERTQASAYNEVMDNLKQNELLIHVDYSETYNNKQQWEIQSAYFGHASFSIFTACCYFKDESNAINKEAITVTSETSDHSRSASVSCLQKVIHFVREKHTHLPLKLNAAVRSDGCAAQFCSRYYFSYCQNLKRRLTLAGSITSGIIEKVQWMELVAL